MRKSRKRIMAEVLLAVMLIMTGCSTSQNPEGTVDSNAGLNVGMNAENSNINNPGKPENSGVSAGVTNGTPAELGDAEETFG